MFNQYIDYKVKCENKDREGYLIQLEIEAFDMKINLVNIYAPNHDNPAFFRKVQNITMQSMCDLNIICGDFNLVLDPQKDSYNYKHVNNPNSRKEFIEMIEACELTDIF